ncbi:hypothetical protein [uncultured Reyranella sp.]|uniref:hypothetical protein n=1 Tax=uncultured Reyranella sp. TaxID=735512 RepID=UPI00259D112E|nr:hypothetical protein [uncultured Reyranella sp.]
MSTKEESELDRLLNALEVATARLIRIRQSFTDERAIKAAEEIADNAAAALRKYNPEES